MSDLDIELLNNAFLKNGIGLTDIQRDCFFKYYEMLIEKNKVMNLTAITEWEDVIHKHFLDSIIPFKNYIKMTQVSFSIIDVGTGAGLPGIPLKIMFPDIKVTLLDSLNKRVGFLNEVINELELDGIEAIHGRAEDYGKDKSYRERYDFAVSRAVAKMSLLSEICLPFVKVGGKFIAYKTADNIDELSEAKTAIDILGGDINGINISEYEISGFDTRRAIYEIIKDKNTPDKFPRKAGVIKKRPLV